MQCVYNELHFIILRSAKHTSATKLHEFKNVKYQYVKNGLVLILYLATSSPWLYTYTHKSLYILII
jgi:hypothetical protein